MGGPLQCGLAMERLSADHPHQMWRYAGGGKWYSMTLLHVHDSTFLRTWATPVTDALNIALVGTRYAVYPS